MILGVPDGITSWTYSNHEPEPNTEVQLELFSQDELDKWWYDI